MGLYLVEVLQTLQEEVTALLEQPLRVMTVLLLLVFIMAITNYGDNNVLKVDVQVSDDSSTEGKPIFSGTFDEFCEKLMK